VTSSPWRFWGFDVLGAHRLRFDKTR
jgi:hypothetical protein